MRTWTTPCAARGGERHGAGRDARAKSRRETGGGATAGWAKSGIFHGLRFTPSHHGERRLGGGRTKVARGGRSWRRRAHRREARPARRGGGTVRSCAWSTRRGHAARVVRLWGAEELHLQDGACMSRREHGPVAVQSRSRTSRLAPPLPPRRSEKSSSCAPCERRERPHAPHKHTRVLGAAESDRAAPAPAQHGRSTAGAPLTLHW